MTDSAKPMPLLSSQRKDARDSNLSEFKIAESLYCDTLMQSWPPESKEDAPSSNHRENTFSSECWSSEAPGEGGTLVLSFH